MTPEPLDDALLRDIAAAGSTRHYRAGTILIHEGDVADALFVILSGRVKVYASRADGRELVLNEHGAGEYVGELPLDGGVRSASVMTTEPTTCAVVAAASVRDFLAQHPDFALHVIRSLIRRLRALTDSAKSLAHDDVYGRVVGLLQRLAVADGDARAVPGRLTQQDIADRIGASREMVSRVFKQLTLGGYVKSERGRIVLLRDPPAGW